MSVIKPRVFTSSAPVVQGRVDWHSARIAHGLRQLGVRQNEETLRILHIRLRLTVGQRQGLFTGSVSSGHLKCQHICSAIEV